MVGIAIVAQNIGGKSSSDPSTTQCARTCTISDMVDINWLYTWWKKQSAEESCRVILFILEADIAPYWYSERLCAEM